MTAHSVPMGRLDLESPALLRTAGIALAIGAAGIVVVSICYALSPPDAAMPVLPLDIQAAMAGAERGRATMYAAGLAAVPGDVLTAAACLLLGVLDAAKGRAVAAMGWLLIAVSLVLFTIVDVVLGFVLPLLAASAATGGPPGAPAFLAMKTFFNAMFLASTAVFGGGAALAMLPHVGGAGEVPRALAAPAVIVGLIALAGGMSGLIGMSARRFSASALPAGRSSSPWSVSLSPAAMCGRADVAVAAFFPKPPLDARPPELLECPAVGVRPMRVSPHSWGTWRTP